MAATTTSSPSGYSGNIWKNSFRSTATQFRPAPPSSRQKSSSSQPPASTGGGCANKVDGVAMWFVNGVANAFFASLERCSCIRVTTVEDGDDFNELPLICNDGNLVRHEETDGTSTAAGELRKRRNRGNAGGKKGS